MNPQNGYATKDYPILLWIFGAFLALGGLFLATRPGGLVFGLVLIVAGALLAFVLGHITTIEADRARGVLSIRERSLLRNAVKEYPLQDITGTSVETSVSHHRSKGRSRTTRTYRVVVTLASGERVPLQSYSSSGSADKEASALRLAESLGVPYQDTTSPAAVVQNLQDIARRANQ